jgi:hypothetical protein
VHGPGGILHLQQDALRAFEEHRPGRRGLGSLAEPVDEALAQVGFQFLDLLAEGRLGNEASPGGGGETAGLQHGHEIPELVQFHRF